MKSYGFLFILVIAISLFGCVQTQNYQCPDGRRVDNPQNCFTNISTEQPSGTNLTVPSILPLSKSCPVTCDDNNVCTKDLCDSGTDYGCVHDLLDGDRLGCSGTIGTCQKQTCLKGTCSVQSIAPCCGNNICESSEDCSSCPNDCSCSSGEICAPDRKNSGKLGCYSVVCGDGYIDTGETSTTCCKDAGCSSNLICDANLNKCVKPVCQYECCQGDSYYQDKGCPQYYECNNTFKTCKALDSDNDALPDYKEVEIGSNLSNPDTDNDTVLDGYDAHPRYKYIDRQIDYTWWYKPGGNWISSQLSLSINISEDVIGSYELIPKGFDVKPIIYMNDTHLDEIAGRLDRGLDKSGYSNADKIMAVIAFSRSFDYDSEKVIWSESNPVPDWSNFPMETIVKKQGLCADSAVMATALLVRMEVDAVYLVSNGSCYLNSPGHAIVGIADTDGFTLYGTERYAVYKNKKYYYVDATSSNFAGNIIYASTSLTDFGTTFCTSNFFVPYD